MSTNNENKKYAAITNGEVYYGRDAQESKALSARYYGNTMVISFHRPLPESKQTKGSKYDYKTGPQIHLTAKAAKALARLIAAAETKRLNGEKLGKSKGVTTGSNVIEVGPGDKYGCDPDKLCLAIYKDIDSEKKAEVVDVFEFKDDVIIVGYDPKTGDYSNESINTDADYFVEQLKDFARGMSNGLVHAYKRETKFDMDRIITRQLQIMSALGIKNDSSYSSSKSDWNSGNASWSNNKPAYSESTSDLMDEIANI